MRPACLSWERMRPACGDGLLMAGMFARMRLTVGGGTGLANPASAVHEDVGKAQMFVAEDPGGDGKESPGTYRKIPVQLERSFGSRVEALSGLKPGQKVVPQGAYRLHLRAGEGQQARPMEHWSMSMT